MLRAELTSPRCLRASQAQDWDVKGPSCKPPDLDPLSLLSPGCLMPLTPCWFTHHGHEQQREWGFASREETSVLHVP